MARRMLHRTLLVHATLAAYWGGAAVAVDRPPGSVEIAADFQADMRSKYTIQGPVNWERGRLTLAPGGTLTRFVKAGPVAELSGQYELPPPAREGEFTTTRWGLALQDNHLVLVELARTRREGGVRGSLLFRHWYKDQEKKDVERKRGPVPLPDGDLGGPWTIRYRRGLVEVLQGGRRIAFGVAGSNMLGMIEPGGAIAGQGRRPLPASFWVAFMLSGDWR